MSKFKFQQSADKKCARPDCGKTVYPLEELRCLDKVWHKQCFKCTNCGMTLGMKSYKGYDKMPYCDAHYPKAVASIVSDTPEMRRLAENTKNQSLVQYHAEFERQKGSKIEVADDPELKRHLKNTQTISQAVYHGEVKAKEPPSAADYRPDLVARSPTSKGASSAESASTPYSSRLRDSATLIYSSEQGGRVEAPVAQVGSIADYDPLSGQWGSIGRPGSATSPTSAAPTRGTGGKRMRAVFDYAAADADEVSFIEGDILTNCQSIDEGWMTGTVERTKQWGMLPANYVE